MPKPPQRNYRGRLGDATPGRRRTNTRNIKKLFIIVTEGETEREYFRMQPLTPPRIGDTLVRVICETSSEGTNPRSVLRSMRNTIEILQRKKELRSGDAAWLVIDADNSDDAELLELDAWMIERKDRFIAFTKPQFEWWLLLHFRDGEGIATPTACMNALKREYSNYKKGKQLPLTRKQVQDALDRAARLQVHEGTSISDLHAMPGALTTVHFLVQSLLRATEEKPPPQEINR